MSSRSTRRRRRLEALAATTSRAPGANTPAGPPAVRASAWRSETRPTRHDAIAARAREIWAARGRPTGQDLAIWFEAESELFDA